MGSGQGFDRLGEVAVPGDRPMMLPVGTDQVGEDFRIPRVALRAGGDVPFAVPGRRERVDRIHLIAGREQRLHPRTPVGLDPHHHRARLCLAEMIRDQRVQGCDPRDAVRQPAPGQPAPVTVLHLNVVMGFGPVITDEQHRATVLSL